MTIVARSSDRAAALLSGEQIGKVIVYDRAGRVTAKLDTPRCR
jgi:hypothetical protein